MGLPTRLDASQAMCKVVGPHMHFKLKGTIIMHFTRNFYFLERSLLKNKIKNLRLQYLANMLLKFENNTSITFAINWSPKYERLYTFVRNPLLEKHAYSSWLYFKSKKY